MEDCVGRRERTAGGGGSFFLPPPFTVMFKSVPVSWAELSRRSTLRIEGEGKRTWLAWWAWLQIDDHPVSVLTFKRLTDSLRWHNSVWLTHRSTLLPPGQWLITEQRKAVSFYKAQCSKQRVMLLIKKKKSHYRSNFLKLEQQNILRDEKYKKK